MNAIVSPPACASRLVAPGLALALGLSIGVAAADPAAPDSAAPAPAPSESGAGIYERACASCHGTGGQGMPEPFVGFEVPLPDFTDCSFATREPDADWAAVVHEGGPARGFDKLMPAFGDALTDAEIDRALEHVRSFCDEAETWPRGELNMPRPFFTSKAYPEDEAVLEIVAATEGPYEVMNQLNYETRIGARGQVEITLPYIAREFEEDNWTAGFGDLGLSTKWAVLHSLETGSIVALALEVILPTGHEARGLGNGSTVVEPYLAYGQLLPLDAFFQFQGGADISTDPDDLNHEVYWRGVLGMTLVWGRWGRTFSPMVEILGSREIGDAGGSSDHETNWDAVPLMQVSLNTRQHLRAAAGVRLPINDFEKRPSQFVMYLLWDWFDGGLTEGW